MARTLIRKIFLAAFLIATSACGSSAVMTRSSFNSIELGSPVKEVTKNYGDPYSIKNNKNGTRDYRYIERIPIDEETVEENNYVLVIKNGRVVAKRYNQERPPAYDEIYDDDPNNVPN